MVVQQNSEDVENMGDVTFAIKLVGFGLVRYSLREFDGLEENTRERSTAFLSFHLAKTLIALVKTFYIAIADYHLR
jgi:hypothetical protein